MSIDDVLKRLKDQHGIDITQNDNMTYSWKCSYGFMSYSGTGYKTLHELFIFLNNYFVDEIVFPNELLISVDL